MVRTQRKRKVPLPPVSLGGVAFEDSLPLPWVKYPNHYGTFFVFSESEKGPWHFCECCETPVTNLLELNRRYPPHLNADHRRMAPLDSLHVPDEVSEISESRLNNPPSAFEFKKKLCHRCNLIQPTMRYCHEMYGGKFDQVFGWYVNQSFLRYGVSPWGEHHYLEEICPDEIQELIDSYLVNQKLFLEENQKCRPASETEKLKKLRKDYNRAKCELKNTFINFTREEFGFCKVGEGWVTETMIYKLIRGLLPDREILRHHRPDWLQGLELDIYIPSLKLGIEYQGQQHFMAIKAWGGEKAFKDLQARDRRKAEICSSLGVTLIYVEYTDPITKRFVSRQLTDAGIPN